MKTNKLSSYVEVAYDTQYGEFTAVLFYDSAYRQFEIESVRLNGSLLNNPAAYLVDVLVDLAWDELYEH